MNLQYVKIYADENKETHFQDMEIPLKDADYAPPAALGCKDWFTAKVKTNGELEAAMQKAEASDTATYIEIVGQKHDYPAGLKLMGSRGYEMYGI